LLPESITANEPPPLGSTEGPTAEDHALQLTDTGHPSIRIGVLHNMRCTGSCQSRIRKWPIAQAGALRLCNSSSKQTNAIVLSQACARSIYLKLYGAGQTRRAMVGRPNLKERMPLGHSAILGTGEVRRFKHAPIGRSARASSTLAGDGMSCWAEDSFVGEIHLRNAWLQLFSSLPPYSRRFRAIATRGSLIMLTLWTCFNSGDLVRSDAIGYELSGTNS
jgi:hypothetical protein